MLRTGKQVWEATAKRSALGLRKEELEFHVTRYTTLVTQVAVLAGFSFDGLVHIDIAQHPDAPPSAVWLFFASLSCAVLFALYVVCTGATLIVFAQQMALFGVGGESLEEAVTLLRARRQFIFGCGFASAASFAVGLLALASIKMGEAAGFVGQAFALFVVVTLFSVARIFMAIGGRELVTGSARFYHSEGGYVDLARIQPGAAKGDRSGGGSGTAFGQPQPEDEV